MRSKRDRELLKEIHHYVALAVSAYPKKKWTINSLAADAKLSHQTVDKLLHPHKDYAPSSLTLSKFGVAIGMRLIFVGDKPRLKVHRPRKVG